MMDQTLIVHVMMWILIRIHNWGRGIAIIVVVIANVHARGVLDNGKVMGSAYLNAERLWLYAVLLDGLLMMGLRV